MATNHVARYFEQVSEVARKLDQSRIQALVDELVALRERQGRLFILGVGGSAGNATHAVNDFRKICGIESYTPTDNVSELTARINDDGWETSFSEWLRGSRLLCVRWSRRRHADHQHKSHPSRPACGSRYDESKHRGLLRGNLFRRDEARQILCRQAPEIVHSKTPLRS